MAMRVMVMEMPGKRKRGRPKRMCLDHIRNDLSERELSVEEASHKKHRSHINVGKDSEEEEDCSTDL